MNKKHGKNNMFEFQRHMKKGMQFGMPNIGGMGMAMGDEYEEGGFDFKGMKGMSPFDRYKEQLKRMSPPFPEGKHVSRN